jgi:beta-glucosidase
VETEQANEVPGTALVTFIDPVTVDKIVYAVSFGVSSVSDEFASSELGGQWSWIRENPANWSLSDQRGSLVITSGKGALTEKANNAENILLQGANTDWTIESRIVCSRKPSGFSQNAGILAYQDDDNFVKLVYRASFGRGSFGRGRPGEQPGSVELLIESGGDQKTSSTLPMDGIISSDNTLILKLVKIGDEYSASVSSGGKKFETVGKGNVVLQDIRAGVMVCDGELPSMFAGFRRFMPQIDEPDTPFKVSFDYFRISNSGLK